jgi:hypothetical protein
LQKKKHKAQQAEGEVKKPWLKTRREELKQKLKVRKAYEKFTSDYHEH